MTVTVPAAVQPPAPALLSAGPVAPRLVHKVRVESVLLGSWAGSPPAMTCTTRWVGHPFFRLHDDGEPGLLLLAETLRQAVIFVAHNSYAVPLDSAFVMRAMSIDPLGVAGSPKSAVTVRVRFEQVRLRAGSLASTMAMVSFFAGGELFATGVGDLVVLPAASYARLRHGAAPVHYRSQLARVSPGQVAVPDSADVVVARDEDGHLRLALDTAHPYLFDHPGDHVPGMALIAGALQAAALVGAPAQGLSARFIRYAEHRPDLRIELGPGPGGSGLGARFVQGVDPVAEITVRG